jgi:glycosyltransferase involved in cell wall biosynthesis
MKIVHCCLAMFYIDDYAYQENILPRIHQRQGHAVAILASTETYIDNRTLGYVAPRSYKTKDGIPITRLPYTRTLPPAIVRKLRIYRGLYPAIEALAPDVVFLHGCQFVSIRDIASYAKRHPLVRIYVDGHADLINSARTWISRHVLHGLVYRYCAKAIEPCTRKFYGVLPLRVEFFQKIYGIPAAKTELLVLGAEDAAERLLRQAETRSRVRRELGLSEDAFVVVSGGKLDRRKNIHLLLQIIRELNRENIKMILFGVPNEEMRDELSRLSDHTCIRYVGWSSTERVYDYLMASDLGVFPGTHSILWEQSVGVGLPCIFKKWEGMQHVDVGGNCLFLERGDPSELAGAIVRLCEDKNLFAVMKGIARNKGVKLFSYEEIARKAISD